MVILLLVEDYKLLLDDLICYWLFMLLLFIDCI